jgi:hypothetical protein
MPNTGGAQPREPYKRHTGEASNGRRRAVDVGVGRAAADAALAKVPTVALPLRRAAAACERGGMSAVPQLRLADPRDVACDRGTDHLLAVCVYLPPT